MLKDPKAVRRGVKYITVWPADWEIAGCPTTIRFPMAVVSIVPTGRKPGHFHWYYRSKNLSPLANA